MGVRRSADLLGDERARAGRHRLVPGPGHDSYWQSHRDQFLELLPPRGRLTLDIGCGEGRLARDLITEPRRRRWQRLPLFLHIRAIKP